MAKGGTVTKHATEGDEHCIFPFLLHGSTYYSCIEKVLCGSACKNGKQRAPSKYKANSICALSPNLSNDRRWGFCPQDMEGLWTQWTSWKRLKIKDSIIKFYTKLYMTRLVDTCDLESNNLSTERDENVEV